ncbi:probable acyl-activating enzyme 16, chloroplastic [Chenopodium quinoa]|uniref:AMP-dependent synthetase/ligase domain-containing protein n=1 Tax=Chenopodium quinoa TaxID=63459 RepID=A0A803LZK1_CHEQI|nr:probable acyl-activating enzyme 16, chloroplastic [Chenopodium quinoa]
MAYTSCNMTNISLDSGLILNSFNHRKIALNFFPCNSKWVFNNFTLRSWTQNGSFRRTLGCVCCHTAQTEELQNRRCAPLLEHEILYNKVLLGSSDWKAVPDIWRTAAEKYGDRIALLDPYHEPPLELTYKQLEQEILDFSEGLRAVGVKPVEKVALFADNSCRWLIADQGTMATGAINVVRGSRSSTEELLQIYKHSESVALIVDNPQLFDRMADLFVAGATTKFVILLWGEKADLNVGESDRLLVYNYNDIVAMGKESRKHLADSYDARKLFNYEPICSNDIATLMYTSGTTGNPKGVMITHQNLLHQIKSLWDIAPVQAGDKFLSMLPPWHAYERAAEYFIFSRGGEQMYTTVKNLKEDLKNYQPEYLISVPLVYETLYSAIQKQISANSVVRKIIALALIKISLIYMELKRIYEGKYLTKKQQSFLTAFFDWLWARLAATVLWPIHNLAKILLYRKIKSAIGISKAGISGGGSLPMYVDKFFEAIGIIVQNGYGLTEASPVVAGRRPAYNVLGSVGHPLKHTEIKVVDANTNEVLSPGSKGIVKVRGPQVMKGYFKNPSATRQVMDDDGWLTTGDLGWIAPSHSAGRSRLCGGVLVLEGRAKDTIVLSTGENVEPSEIEEAAMRSSLIEQIVVVGQDQRRLGAIIVPNKEEVLHAAKKLSLIDANSSELGKERLTSLLQGELRKWTSECSFQVGPILIVDDPFTIESGLMTPTLKIRRDVVADRYRDQIANLYK